jgi:NAD(P)-dependent dehydrogenase (short-subunit alcohol dehydrogenase family)
MPALNSNSVALITASSAGLGAETARAMAAAGVRVVINYRSSREKADALLEEFASLAAANRTTAGTNNNNSGNFPARQDKRFIAIQADVSKRAEISGLVDEAVAAMGRLDVVVSNQGWTRMRDFYDLDDNVEESDWDLCFNMNVKSHLFLMHAARRHLEATEGAFITTASLAGVTPSGSSLVRDTFFDRRLVNVRGRSSSQAYSPLSAGILGDKSSSDTLGEGIGNDCWGEDTCEFGFAWHLAHSESKPPIVTCLSVRALLIHTGLGSSISSRETRTG